MEKGGKCKFNKQKVVMTVSGGLDLPDGEDVLKKFVARYGPVAIGIVGEDIQPYKSGIFNDLYCVANDTDHAVLIVGYGTDSKDGDYWIVVSRLL
jgi:cathepsin L